MSQFSNGHREVPAGSPGQDTDSRSISVRPVGNSARGALAATPWPLSWGRSSPARPNCASSPTLPAEVTLARPREPGEENESAAAAELGIAAGVSTGFQASSQGADDLHVTDLTAQVLHLTACG